MMQYYLNLLEFLKISAEGFEGSEGLEGSLGFYMVAGLSVYRFFASDIEVQINK